MAGERKSGSEPYPAVRQDDAIEQADKTGPATGEGRSFAPAREAPSIDESWLGPRGDPAEGKR